MSKTYALYPQLADVCAAKKMGGASSPTHTRAQSTTEGQSNTLTLGRHTRKRASIEEVPSERKKRDPERLSPPRSCRAQSRGPGRRGEGEQKGSRQPESNRRSSDISTTAVGCLTAWPCLLQGRSGQFNIYIAPIIRKSRFSTRRDSHHLLRVDNSLTAALEGSEHVQRGPERAGRSLGHPIPRLFHTLTIESCVGLVQGVLEGFKCDIQVAEHSSATSVCVRAG